MNRIIGVPRLISNFRDPATSQDVAYRLVTDEKQYLLERAERDAMGGDRWVKVRTWSGRRDNLSAPGEGENALLGLLAALIEKLVDENDGLRVQTANAEKTIKNLWEETNA